MTTWQTSCVQLSFLRGNNDKQWCYWNFHSLVYSLIFLPRFINFFSCLVSCSLIETHSFLTLEMCFIRSKILNLWQVLLIVRRTRECQRGFRKEKFALNTNCVVIIGWERSRLSLRYIFKINAISQLYNTKLGFQLTG